MSGEMVPPQYSPSNAAFSVPHHLWGAAQFTALSGSFGHLCASRNAQVPLRYTSQPFRRKSAPSRSLKAAWLRLSNRFFDSGVTAKCRRNFLSVLAVETSVFCAGASLLCSALALRRGTFRRFERLVWASLHLSERSRTIEVRVATLSAQTCTKSLTQSYLFYFSITCYFTYKDKK